MFLAAAGCPRDSLSAEIRSLQPRFTARKALVKAKGGGVGRKKSREIKAFPFLLHPNPPAKLGIASSSREHRSFPPKNHTLSPFAGSARGLFAEMAGRLQVVWVAHKETRLLLATSHILGCKRACKWRCPLSAPSLVGCSWRRAARVVLKPED